MYAIIQILWHKTLLPSWVFVVLYYKKIDCQEWCDALLGWWLATDEVYNAFSQDSDASFQKDSTHFFQKYNYKIVLESILLLSQDSWSVEWLINWFMEETRAQHDFPRGWL